MADDAALALILLTKWCYTEMASRENNYLHTVLNNMTLLCTKCYQNWLMSVDDIAKTLLFLSMTEKTHFRGS